MVKPLHGPTAPIDRPRNTRPVIPILKVGARDRFAMAICSPLVHGRVVHWDGSRTQPCTIDRGTCRLCDEQRPRRDKGFLLVANTLGQLRGFLELTPLAWEELLRLLPETGSFRGLCIECRRLNNSERGRLVIEPLGHYTGELVLPADRSPDETLARIWGLEQPS